MTAVLIHASGIHLPQGRRNWERTIERAVDFRAGRPAEALSSWERAELERLHPDGSAQLWGTHGYYSAQAARLAEGDVVIFTGKGRVLAIGRIGLLTDNRALADALWPRHPRHGSYRHVYSLAPLDFVDIPYPEFRARGGFGAADDFRGLRVLTGARADEILAEFSDEIPSEARDRDRDRSGRADLSHGGGRGMTVEVTDAAGVFPPAQGDLLAQLEAMGGTDAAGAARAVRREQGLLRDYLGIGPSAGDAPVQCGLCGRYFPRGLLVAAHVKPRSECTEEERLDIPSVAMAACLLGCDALYEAGYLAIDGTGRILTADGEVVDALRAVLRALEGRLALAWTPQREPYFEWHRANRFRGRVVADTRG